MRADQSEQTWVGGGGALKDTGAKTEPSAVQTEKTDVFFEH